MNSVKTFFADGQISAIIEIGKFFAILRLDFIDNILLVKIFDLLELADHPLSHLGRSSSHAYVFGSH